MKERFEKILMVVIMSAIIAACVGNQQPAGADAGSTTALKSESSHQAYRCPMNCEEGKTYGKAGKCPVCGMKLEPVNSSNGLALTYKMQYNSQPEQLTAGQPATLSFSPVITGTNNKTVDLDVQHEKKIHLIVVSDDLSYFEHIHPDQQPDGKYQIKVLGKGQHYTDGPGKAETVFAHGGRYFLFADYKPSGGTHQVEKIPLTVTGTEKPLAVFKNEKLSGTSGGYSVVLKPGTGKLATGAQMHMAAVVQKGGKQINANTLENYLGAKAHMVVLSLDEKEYLHVHPEVVNGVFDLHTTFKKPGIYRSWIQFQDQEKVHTVDFTLKVAQGTGDKNQQAGADHSGHASEHSH
jgi:hypothetical protein